MVKEVEEAKERVEEFAEGLEEASGIFDEDFKPIDEDAPIAGIFDEDFKPIDEDAASSGVFDGDFLPFDEEAPVSDFDIGSTMLATATPVESWAGQNLEDTLSRDWVKKDWDDEEDAFSGDFYKSSNDRDNVYGASGSDAYSSKGKGNDFYSEAGGTYDAKAGTYDVKGGDTGALRSHEQVRDERRGGQGLLESSFSDRHKRDNRAFNRDAVAYEPKDAM